MEIKVSQTPLYLKNNCFNNHSMVNTNNSYKDTFEKNNSKNKQVSFKGFSIINYVKNNFINRPSSEVIIMGSDEKVSSFAQDIAKDMKRVLGRDTNVKPSDLKCVMSPDEIRAVLPKLEERNFISSEENIKKGYYCADLDYQTGFSNVKKYKHIYDIMDEVANYADSYHKRTKRNFMFAITDTDSLEGIQHALRVVSENPEKFKHVKLIPGIKMSYAHEAKTSQLKYENSHMLIYGINPFSKNLTDLVDGTIEARKRMINEFIKKVYTLYPEFTYKVLEFAQQNGIKYKKSYGVSNLYWRVREYAETKGDTAIRNVKLTGKELGNEIRDIRTNIAKVLTGSENVHSIYGTSIIKQNNEDINQKIKGVFEFYSTHEDPITKKVVSSAENVYENMIERLSMEKEKPVLALASPYYLVHYNEEHGATEFPNVVDFINKLKASSNDMLTAFESVVPGYEDDKNLTTEQIQNYNDYIRKNTDLYEVGGSFDKL